MSLDKFRCDIKTLTGLNLEPIPDDDLSRENPAHVSDSGDIHIFSGLKKDEPIEAEGHELAHLWLEYNGLIVLGGAIGAPCPFSNPEYDDIYEWLPHLDFLALELTMAVHHPDVFKLNDMYNISNNLQISSRFTPLDEMMKKLEEKKDFTAVQHGYGFQLLDVHRTILPLSDYMNVIRKEYPEVERAFLAAEQVIPQINATISLEAQLEICQNIVHNLGYDKSIFHIRNMIR